jgi:hypothetical protein
MVLDTSPSLSLETLCSPSSWSRKRRRKDYLSINTSADSRGRRLPLRSASLDGKITFHIILSDVYISFSYTLPQFIRRILIPNSLGRFRPHISIPTKTQLIMDLLLSNSKLHISLPLFFEQYKPTFSARVALSIPLIP